VSVHPNLARRAVVCVLLGLSSYVVVFAGGQPQTPADVCRIDGRITSAGVPLPGVAVGITAGESSHLLTSTDVNGSYSLVLTPNASYRLFTDFGGFAPAERDVALGATPCATTLDFELTLGPKSPVVAPAPPASAAPTEARTEETSPSPRRSPAAPAPSPGGRGGGAQRFQRLNVQRSNRDTGEPEAGSALENGDVAALLPPGFSLDTAQGDTIALGGAGNAATINRGVMNDRLRAIDAGELDPATGQFGGFGPGGPGGAPGGFAGRGGPGGPGPGRFGGPGAFALAGRGARGQRPYQGSANYTFGGSSLNSAPYQLRPDVPVTQPPFTQNNYGATFGGPVKIPGLYKDELRRTSFQVNYSGNESSNVFDQYATVPTDAMRQGDFSATPAQLVDPRSGQPFAGNQIPKSSIDPTAASLLAFIPAPNLPGDTHNYHVSTTSHNSSTALSLRLSQNLSPSPSENGPGRPGGPGGRGGFGSGGGGPGGFGRGGGRLGNGSTSIILNAQLQYRENQVETLNVFPDLSEETTNRRLTVPLSLNVARHGIIQNFSVNYTHLGVETTNNFANVQNVAGLAGIQYPTGSATDPQNWGVPNLTFSSFTGLRSAAATESADDRFTASYMWIHPSRHHRSRFGVDFRVDRSTSLINGNARGGFVFTGAYAAPGVVGATGADFADFLLGATQQASLEVGGTSELRQRAMDAFFEDNWQVSPKVTLNMGLRYELARPYVEVNGRMANLDAASDLSAVSSVLPGGVGPYTGAFPAGLLDTDANNLGPRLGLAYRMTPTLILRSGYSITYNSGSYASIARELAGQPPFADTVTVAADDTGPLTIAEALLTPAPQTPNNWGVDRDYAIGTIQTWNVTLTKNFTQDWMLQGGYTGVKGTDLDILRAPALVDTGTVIPGAAAFIWESSDGRSLMNAENVQLRRRLAHGVAGGLSYTFAHAMDDASSLGAGGPVVAQNDKDLAAEYARSSFERRHQVSANVYLELPWGPNRRWLKDGGTMAALFGEWSAQFTFTAQSGAPLTARVLGSQSDLLRGVNGSLRANYDGQPIALSNPTVDQFFNTMAFGIPDPGTFGTSSRNMIIGPGTRQLNGLFQRDIRFGGDRSVTLQVNAINLLNTVQWASVDGNINSPTFGDVLSARPMRAVTVAVRVRF